MGRAEVAARPVIAYRDAYNYLQTHPDVIGHVWSQLGASMPQESRYIVCSTPALVHSHSGIIFVAAVGMDYFLRLPPKLLSRARRAGVKSTKQYGGGIVRDLGEHLESEWVFGAYKDAEIEWVWAAYEHFGQPRSK